MRYKCPTNRHKCFYDAVINTFKTTFMTMIVLNACKTFVLHYMKLFYNVLEARETHTVH